MINDWKIREETFHKYINACIEALEFDTTFDKFRQDPRYTAILEHTSDLLGTQYFNQIINQGNTWILDHCFFNDNTLIKKLNLIGGPKLSVYSDIDRGRHYLTSNTIMQYLGVYSNIYNFLKKYDSLKDCETICEIGGGFGGQAAVLMKFGNFKSYTIYDLTPVNLLQKKFLTKLDFNTDEDWYFNGTNHFIYGTKYGLVISNYALSELIDEVQNIYLNQVLLNSKHGYLTFNSGCKYLDILKDNFPNLVVSKDIEGEVETNFIIQW